MLEACLDKTSLLKKIIDALKDVLNQSVLDCSDSGLQLQSMDDSHVSLVSLSMSSSGFEKYRCDRNLSLGLNLSTLSKILRCANSDDSVTIRAEDKADTVRFVFKSDERTSEYDLRLLNLDQDHLGIPDTDYACTVCMPAMEFARICRDLTMFSETIVISCNKDGIKFSSNGDLGNANIKVAQSDEENDDNGKGRKRVTIKTKDPVTLSFAGRYLMTFTRATPLSEKVKLGLSADMPLLVEYTIEDFGYLRYYLAPKIDETND